MASTTTLKLPAKLKARIARLANQTGRSAHSVMLEALERGVARAERVREFVREALAADAAVEAGAAVCATTSKAESLSTTSWKAFRASSGSRPSLSSKRRSSC